MCFNAHCKRPWGYNMKEYARLCTKYGTMLSHFRVPVGSVYGKNHGRFFVVRDYSKIKSLELMCSVSRDGLNWEPQKITGDNKIFRAVYNCLLRDNNGRIPVIRSFNDPYKIVPDLPKERRVNTQYLRYGSTYRELLKRNGDNSDFGGGGDAVMGHYAKNQMKVITGKCPKPEWETPSKYFDGVKTKDLSAHDGEIHTAGSAMTCGNTMPTASKKQLARRR